MPISVKNLEERLKALETAIGTKLPLAGGTMTGNINYGSNGGTLGTIFSSVPGRSWFTNSGNDPSGITIKTPTAGSYAHSAVTQLVDGVKKASLEFLNDGNVIRMYVNGNIVGATFTASNFTAPLIYNAVFNDYAEFYEKGEDTEPGHIIALSQKTNKELYVKASKENPNIVGVHSDSFGHIVGGESPLNNEDPIEYNKKNFIPVGLVGRVKTFISGPVEKGDKIKLSPTIPGVGVKYQNFSSDNTANIIGFVVENDPDILNDKGIRRVKMQLIPWGGDILNNIKFLYAYIKNYFFGGDYNYAYKC